MLEVVGINKKFKDTTALNNINLSFGKKGLVAILGESGSGKSTLFNILTGVVKADSGQVLYDGIPLNTDGKINSRNIFGIIFQDGNLLGGLTVKQNLDICSADTQKQTEILQNLGIKKYINTKVSKLSGGEMQRVAIARALLDDSKILLADEPTGSLDEKNGENVMSILKEISSRKLVLVITHNVEFANKYADRIIKIYKGDIQEDSQSLENSCSADNKQGFANTQEDLQQNTNDKPRQLTFSSLNKFCFAKLKNTFVKNITSIFILAVMLILIAIPTAVVMMNCRKEYFKYIEKYEYSTLYNDDKMSVFEQKLVGADTQGLMRYYNYYSTDGESKYIIVDDSLKDNEIKLGYATTQALNNKIVEPLKEGDAVEYFDKSFVVTEFIRDIPASEEININRAVYLNDKTAKEIILTPEVSVVFNLFHNEAKIVIDDTLKEGDCIINFGLYYSLGKYNPDYIDLRKNTITWQIQDYRTTLYEKDYIIKSVDTTNENASEYILYVSPADYQEISMSRLYYGYFIETNNKDLVDYWWDRNVDIYNENFYNYRDAQYTKELVLPFAYAILVAGIILTALYMLTILNHISAMNTRELYILKTLRIGQKSIFGILILQAIPVLLCANIIALIVNIITKVLVEKNILFFVLQVAGSNILLLAISLLTAIAITLIKMLMLNKKFNINLTR